MGRRCFGLKGSNHSLSCLRQISPGMQFSSVSAATQHLNIAILSKNLAYVVSVDLFKSKAWSPFCNTYEIKWGRDGTVVTETRYGLGGPRWG